MFFWPPVRRSICHGDGAPAPLHVSIALIAVTMVDGPLAALAAAQHEHGAQEDSQVSKIQHRDYPKNGRLLF